MSSTSRLGSVAIRLLSPLLFLSLLVPVAQARDMVSVNRPEINMRTGPGTDHEAVWSLIKGYPLEVIGRKGQWYHVSDFERDKGWVYRPITGKTPHHVVKVKIANIRSGPSTSSRVVGKAVYGEVLRTLERRRDWVKIRPAIGPKGWISRSLLWGW